MSIKLNGYKIPYKTIDTMRKTAHKSFQIKKEMGFALCADKDNNINVENMCTGKECRIKIKEKCGKQETYVGHYHTHPDDTSTPSAGDLATCGINRIQCTSGQEDNKTTCYIWQHELIDRETYEELFKLYNRNTRRTGDITHEKNFDCMKEFISITRIQSDIGLRIKDFINKGKEIKSAMKDKVPQHKIETMKKRLLSEMEDASKISSDALKKTVELTPKYYKEKILW